jgi:L-seryl-tRNA(Ser) seleniumtransferase
MLADQRIAAIAGHLRHEVVVDLLQGAIDRARAMILAGKGWGGNESIVDEFASLVGKLDQPRLRVVINATGVVVHTNLGRAPVSAATAAAMSEAGTQYTPLELELETGRRGGRMSEIARLMATLTGAESTLVVNNNAAAILLTLSALCSGREVILSRAQAVEIGGGFRVPDVMRQSGADLVEVGTTNRTYARDYRDAITDRTAAILAVHWSNFRIIGFTAQPTLSELASEARERGVFLIEDLGSGALVDTARYGLEHEPTVGESLTAGVDVVCFSGDKLLGGPQAGIISGRRDLVERIAAHPLARAVRADKTALAGIAATLRHYLRDDYDIEIPIWRMIASPLDELERRCRRWLDAIGRVQGLEIIESTAAVGGGSLPGETLPSRALAISEDAARERGWTLDGLSARLRSGSPPIMAPLERGRLLLDARTVLPGQDTGLIEAVRVALGDP